MKPDEYWESDSAFRDQKFYTAFCILVAACSDYAIGATLQRDNKLNWACTALYYSLVHSSRLIIFIETGDFPTNHSDISSLFSEGRLTPRTTNTWVNKTLRPFAKEQGFEVEAFDFLKTSLSLSGNIRQYLGGTLEMARNLRNDSNYEGLLISHEYDHIKVSGSFNRLASEMRKASRIFLPIMIEQFKSFINGSPRKDHWYAFLNWKSTGVWSTSSSSTQVGEGLYYLLASLDNRQVSHESISELEDWLVILRDEPNKNIKFAREVIDNIVMSSFGIKNNLMNAFESKINEFTRRKPLSR